MGMGQQMSGAAQTQMAPRPMQMSTQQSMIPSSYQQQMMQPGKLLSVHCRFQLSAVVLGRISNTQILIYFLSMIVSLSQPNAL